MYFSSSLFYSSRYAKDSPEGKPFIICMIAPGNVYPGLLSFHFFFSSLFFFHFFHSFFPSIFSFIDVSIKKIRISDRKSIY